MQLMPDTTWSTFIDEFNVISNGIQRLTSKRNMTNYINGLEIFQVTLFPNSYTTLTFTSVPFKYLRLFTFTLQAITRKIFCY